MSHTYMPAQQIKALINKSCQPRIHDNKVIVTLRESKDSVVTLVGRIDNNQVVDVNATLIEQHYSGDDQLSSVFTDNNQVIKVLNKLVMGA